MSEIEQEIVEIKQLRVEQDAINKRIKALADKRPAHGGELTLAWRNGQTVRHRLGAALGVIRDVQEAKHGIAPAHPYPDADKPENTKIAPTADTAE